MNLPNKLTLSRIILGPLFLLSFISGQKYLSCFFLFLNFFGDIIDGMLARKRKETTKLGEILDPSIDLLFFLFVGLSFSLEGLSEINWFLVPVVLILLSFFPNIKNRIFQKKPLRNGPFQFVQSGEVKIFHTKTKYIHSPLIYAYVFSALFNLNFKVIFWLAIVIFTLTCFETFLRSIKFSFAKDPKPKHLDQKL